MTDYFSEHKLIFVRRHKVEEKMLPLMMTGGVNVFQNCSTTVEKCVANHIHTFGHANYSKQMCLLVLLKNVYWHFHSFSAYALSMCLFSERSIYCITNVMGCDLREVSGNPRKVCCVEIMSRSCPKNMYSLTEK